MIDGDRIQLNHGDDEEVSCSRTCFCKLQLESWGRTHSGCGQVFSQRDVVVGLQLEHRDGERRNPERCSVEV